jgi:hypothetical protein
VHCLSDAHGVRHRFALHVPFVPPRQSASTAHSTQTWRAGSHTSAPLQSRLFTHGEEPAAPPVDRPPVPAPPLPVAPPLPIGRAPPEAGLSPSGSSTPPSVLRERVASPLPSELPHAETKLADPKVSIIR